MKLLLITGAGASRNLGVDDSQLPLMAHWAASLCAALNNRERGLASACNLDPDLNGPDFEQALGELLEWERVRHLEEKFEDLGKEGPQIKPPVVKARDATRRRLKAFKGALDETLYKQFSHAAVDDEKATIAYETLLSQLGDPSVVLATTNYDRSAESALLRMGRRVRNGFAGEPPRRQLFKPGNLVDGAGTDTPVLHLHGAVGWYERDGDVVLENAEDGHDPNRGTPVVLYPDPQKEPVANAIVAELWREFDLAVTETPNVLVLGHSLHDRMLVDRLQNLSPKQRLAVSAFSADEQKRVAKLLPDALVFKLDFKPGVGLGKAALKHLDL
ncbi:MAG: hypothetical protein WDZ46_08490 [Solirubrobacterales bacterium]